MAIGRVLSNSRALILACALATLTAAPASAQSCNQLMTGTLKALTANGVVLKLGGYGLHYSGTLTLNKNGTAFGQGKSASGHVFQISGKWHVANNKFCRTWTGGRNSGQQICEIWCARTNRSVWVYIDQKNSGINSW